MDILKSIALFLISPLNLIVLLTLLGVTAVLWKYYRLARYCHFAAFFLLAVFSQPYSAVLLLHPLEFGESYNLQHIALEYTPDILYAPACYYSTTGQKTEVSNFHTCSMQRIVQLARVAQLKPNAQIIVTGGNYLRDQDVFFAEKARALLLSLGIDEQRILAVNKGSTTLSEVQSISSQLNKKTILAISSATHGQRLVDILSPHAAKVYFYPVDFLSNGQLTPFLDLPSATALEANRRALYEYGAIAKYYLFE